MKRLNLDKQFWLATGLIVFGCVLLVAGFIVAPAGQIHDSVLVAFGEILTFAGGLLGIDYSYRKRILDRGFRPDGTRRNEKEDMRDDGRED